MSNPRRKSGVTLVCIPLRTSHDPVAGSVPLRCKQCEELVWVSPTSFDAVQQGASIVCAECAKLEIDAAHARGEPPEWGGFLPGQVEELKRELRDEQNPT